ncbi:MAG: dihydrodipicolinate synthase family protein [Verrucomicrobiota bacterium]
MIDFLKAANGRIPNLAGIKFTRRKIQHSWGRDEILFCALSLGATGAVGSTYNYMPAIYQKVIAAFTDGDLESARAHQYSAIQIIEVMIRHGGLSAAKAIMKMVGIDCGPVRMPLRNLTDTQITNLRSDLEKIGFPFVKSPLPIFHKGTSEY